MRPSVIVCRLAAEEEIGRAFLLRGVGGRATVSFYCLCGAHCRCALETVGSADFFGVPPCISVIKVL